MDLRTIYAGDLKRELEVYVGANPYQKSLRVSEIGLIIIEIFL